MCDDVIMERITTSTESRFASFSTRAASLGEVINIPKRFLFLPIPLTYTFHLRIGVTTFVNQNYLSPAGIRNEDFRNVSLERYFHLVLFATASRPALGPTQPPIQWVPGALSLEVKQPGREADHSPPSSGEVKNAWSYTSTTQYVLMA
jgi:hypothetical protein